MSEIKDGGPAFPCLEATVTGIDSDGNERFETEAYGGMTMRDYIAAKAMAAVVSGENGWRGSDYQPLDGLTTIENDARLAYQYADAMIAARSQP